MMATSMLQSYQGPSDPMLRSNAVEGYTQVSRVGEQVINCFGTQPNFMFSVLASLNACIRMRAIGARMPTVVCLLHSHFAVDSYEFGVVPDTFTDKELVGEIYKEGDNYKNADGSDFPGDTKVVETKPHFYEWATATTGMLAVARKQRSTFRNYVAAETAAPVIACAAGKGPLDELDFQFAGVVRSNSVRTMDDGAGPTTDEYFTLTIGGPATILNTSSEVIHAGDTIAWTFYSESQKDTGSARRAAHGSVRRIGIRIAEFHDECKIGRAINFAKPGQPFDILVQF